MAGTLKSPNRGLLFSVIITNSLCLPEGKKHTSENEGAGDTPQVGDYWAEWLEMVLPVQGQQTNPWRVEIQEKVMRDCRVQREGSQTTTPNMPSVVIVFPVDTAPGI